MKVFWKTAFEHLFTRNPKRIYRDDTDSYYRWFSEIEYNDGIILKGHSILLRIRRLKPLTFNLSFT